jgi:hypothetical protein
MTEFNLFTQQVGDALPILEQMGYEVTTLSGSVDPLRRANA